MQKEPVVSAASLAGLISAVLIWARMMNWIDWSEDAFNQFMIIVSLAIPIGTSVWARGRVTPVDSPRAENTQGEIVRLVPADGSTLPRN